jgi:serine/threonine-protein kinase RsbW
VRAELVIESRIDQVARARQWLSDQARAAGVPERQIQEMGLVVSEACANVIKHAYRGELGHQITLRLDIDQSKVVLSIRDCGAPFDPESYIPPDLDEPREGGYGIFIMRSLMDEVHYDTSCNRGTTLTLVKYRAAPAAGERQGEGTSQRGST